MVLKLKQREECGSLPLLESQGGWTPVLGVAPTFGS